MAEVRHTLIPQFSLRRMLVVISVFALLAFVGSMAGRGQAWAWGASVGIGMLVVAFLLYAFFFALAWLFTRPWRVRKSNTSARSATANTVTTKTLLIVLLALGQYLAAPNSTLAESGGSITLPLLGPKQTNQTGLELTIDSVWVDSPGYRPVRLRLKSINGPAAGSRVFSVRFRPYSGFTNQSFLEVTQSIELPAGSESVEATLSVPQLGAWGSVGFDVFEDGKYVEQLSIPSNVTWTSWSGTASADSAVPTILLLSGSNRWSPTALQIDNSTPEMLTVTSEGLGATHPTGTGSTTPSTIDFSALPKRWIDYSCFDIVLTSRENLRALNTQYARQWQAVREWVESGGTLIVYGAGKKWEQIADLEKLVGIGNQSAASESDLGKRGWKVPKKRTKNEGENAGETNAGASQRTTKEAADELWPADQAPFVMRPLGLGAVVALRSDESFKGTGYDWALLYETMGPARWQWFQRFGVSVSRENNDVWNFLIPGVGLAPVGKFQVFITLFVLVIGPVNYFLLRRWGKLNLMVLTVPAAAILVTLVLISSAVLADGLGIRLRARSFTHIDQHSGEATCWARLSYYAGLAPADGLQFSENTVVFPLEKDSQMGQEAGPARTVAWWRRDRLDAASPLEQRLTAGWLPARTPTQLITARTRKTSAHLEIHPAVANGQRQVVNHLGSRIEQLVLIDEGGQCFVAEHVPANEPAVLKSAKSQNDAYINHLERLVTANQPEPPPAMASSSGARGFFGLGKQFGYQGVYGSGLNYHVQQINTGNLAPASQNTGLLERSIYETANKLRNNELPARTYVAIVETSPEMELGTPAAREEASFHVVAGEW